MTKKGPNNQIGAVKWTLIVGSVAASLLGARLAAVGDAQRADPQAETDKVMVYTGGGTQIVELPAVPTVISPDQLPPAARSRSSR